MCKLVTERYTQVENMPFKLSLKPVLTLQDSRGGFPLQTKCFVFYVTTYLPIVQSRQPVDLDGPKRG